MRRGFTTTAASEKIEFLKAARAEGPKGADESVEITLTMAADEGVEAPVKVVVARTGATVTGFSAINFGAVTSGEEAPFPTRLSDAQLAKLG
ncbi:hypothetical protein ACR6C2_28030 [Streptomyces sp. INA 01156]